MSGELILIVDDNELNVKLARTVLEAHKYQIVVAEDGYKALKLLDDMHPKLILMDIQLPGIDGIEVSRQIKANPATSDITIVAVTAYALKGYEEKAKEVGCVGFITKPINTSKLAQDVRRYLDEAASTRQ